MTPFECEHTCDYCPAEGCEERGMEYNSSLVYSSLSERMASVDERPKDIIMYIANSMPYVECSERLPIPSFEYSTYPNRIFVSHPCIVVTKGEYDGEYRCTFAVYVLATSVAPNNDGSHTHWEGFAETGMDGEPLHGILSNFIDVLRWHYVDKEVADKEITLDLDKCRIVGQGTIQLFQEGGEEC